MKWDKRGLIVSPDPSIAWMSKYAMVPTPFHFPESGIIRVYFGVTSNDNYGVTTYVDLNENNPGEIIDFEKRKPALSLGNDGTFDDCGAIPSSIIKKDDRYLLYYVGFQRTQKVPYMLFPGLAISSDGKEFKRYSESPIIDRTSKYYLSFAAPFVLNDNGVYKMWLWIGKNWVTIKNKKYLSATIGYAESTDGVQWKILSGNCIVPKAPEEFSVGRPWILKEKSTYKMYYSIRYVEKLYRIGYAESVDGINWTRKDEEIGIDVSTEGWDSEMICYPSVIKVNDRTYMFYNGNNNGETGFGWAELMK